MAKTTTFNLSPIPSTNFRVTVQECPLLDPQRRCTNTPEWVTKVVEEGQPLSLPSLIIQAGRHFSDRLNMDVFEGSATRRQSAMALAWAIISMVRPSEVDGRLVVMDPQDSDVKRLCSEVLAVGAALEFVRSQGLIDGRTIKKLGGRFDFQARGRKGSGTVLIEAKGTFEGVSKSAQRKSFFNKLPLGQPRDYSRAIGVIFSTWTDSANRGCDVEILDPEGEPGTAFEESVREVIGFYARRLDDAIGMQRAAAVLFEVAKAPSLMKGDEKVLSQLDLRHKRIFSRAAIVIRGRGTDSGGGNRKEEYWGTFWELRAVPVPPIAAVVKDEQYAFAYTGIDSAVLLYIRNGQFEELLAYSQGADQLFELRSGDFRGHFVLDEYGILRGWMNKIPKEIELDVRA